MTNILKQTLEQNGLTVKDINVSPRGIITITIVSENGQESKPFDVFRSMGLKTKVVSAGKDMVFRVV